MSGELNATTGVPLLSREQASKLLDTVVYERVIACIDIEALCCLEQQLWAALAECGMDAKDAGGVASGLVGAALGRVVGDADLWASFDSDNGDDDCPLCLDLARAEAEAAGARPRKNGKSKLR